MTTRPLLWFATHTVGLFSMVWLDRQIRGLSEFQCRVLSFEDARPEKASSVDLKIVPGLPPARKGAYASATGLKCIVPQNPRYQGLSRRGMRL